MPTPTSAQRGSLKKCHGQGWVCTICPAARSGGRVSFPNIKAALRHERTAHSREPCVVESVKGADGPDGIRSPEKRLQTRDDSRWGKIGHPPLTSEGLRQWEMHAHVDHVFDLVPFWQRGMDAAEKGEVLRLEEFLEKMEGDGGWRTTNEVLGMLGGWKMPPSERPMWVQPYQGDWAASERGAWEPDGLDWTASQRGGWDMTSTRIASDATESSCERNSGWGIREEWADGGTGFKMGRDNAGAMEDARTRVKKVQGTLRDDKQEELHEFVDAIARQEAANEERRRRMHLFFEMSMEQKVEKIEKTIQFLRTHAV